MAMRAAQVLYSFNRGIVSPLALARLDVKRTALAAETQTNWLPRVLGPMMLRPGLGYLGSTASNSDARFLRFIFSTDDTALLELTSVASMRVWINDALLTRPAVTTTIANGTFAGSLASWTDLDEAGAVSQFHAGNFMELVGDGTARAIRQQQVTVAGANIGVEHGVRIVVERGPVSVRIGSTSGGDEYLAETELRTGAHSISIVPAGDFFVRFFSSAQYQVLVTSCTIEAAGVVSVPTPWSGDELTEVRYEQSGDVIFVACRGNQQRRIERRGTRPNARSWSVCLYESFDGPFDVLNTSAITLAASATTGDILIASSQPFFTTGHVGALFSMISSGQTVTATGSASSVATTSIRVTGIDSERVFSIVISGDATGSTVDLQRSYDDSTWANVGGASGTFTADTTTTFDDSLDNQIVFYRLILTTRVAPDSVTMTLRIGSGSVRGIVQVTGYVNTQQMSARVLSQLGGISATLDWQEGMWSDKNGWPTAVRPHEGRMWWFGLNGIWGSISDSYDSFDETFLGNAAPINRTIGSGPVDTINWGLSLKSLVIGAQGAEMTVRASSLDEVITPTNFNVKTPSTQGSAAVEAAKIDQTAYFVDRSSTNLMSLQLEVSSYDYRANNLMKLFPGLGSPGIVRLDVQRKPDTRVHCVRSDGVALVGIIDPDEEVLAWIPVVTDGAVEDVVVLPAESGDKDDRVYYVVQRSINGSTVRYLERWAQEDDCQGGTLNLQADAYKTYSGAAVTNVSVGYFSHLEGESVVVWADGADVGTNDSARPWTQRYTISNGRLSPALPVAASHIVVGLGYSATFKSAKLGMLVQGGSVLGGHKNIGHLALVMANTHPKGIRFGTTFDETGSLAMDDMPGIEEGTAAPTTVQSAYDSEAIEFPGTWSTDMRLCLLAQAPRPVTVLAAVIDMGQN